MKAILQLVKDAEQLCTQAVLECDLQLKDATGADALGIYILIGGINAAASALKSVLNVPTAIKMCQERNRRG